MKNKIKTTEELKPILNRCRRNGEKIAFTNGCFDILHSGHIRYLQAAKKKADKLIVALNSDFSVRKIKGPQRPITKLKDRQCIIAALESVDYVTAFDETTPFKIIGQLRPDLVVKGADWKKENIIGKDIVEGYGGKAITVKYHKGHSSSGIITKIAKKIR